MARTPDPNDLETQVAKKMQKAAKKGAKAISAVGRAAGPSVWKQASTYMGDASRAAGARMSGASMEKEPLTAPKPPRQTRRNRGPF